MCVACYLFDCWLLFVACLLMRVVCCLLFAVLFFRMILVVRGVALLCVDC